jgi:hypothetical protein
MTRLPEKSGVDCARTRSSATDGGFVQRGSDTSRVLNDVRITRTIPYLLGYRLTAGLTEGEKRARVEKNRFRYH